MWNANFYFYYYRTIRCGNGNLFLGEKKKKNLVIIIYGIYSLLHGGGGPVMARVVVPVVVPVCSVDQLTLLLITSSLLHGKCWSPQTGLARQSRMLKIKLKVSLWYFKVCPWGISIQIQFDTLVQGLGYSRYFTLQDTYL